MRLSNKSTFSLVCFIVLLAFAAMPAMAEPTVSAVWTTDVNADGTADDSGWNATLTYAAAPAATVTLPAATPATGTGTATGYFTGNDPTDTTTVGDGTATAFKFNLTPTAAGTDVAVTFADARRVTFRNGRDLASTSIAQPKLKSITAPEAVNQFFTATITFEAEAAAVTGPPAVPEIGPSDGLAQADIGVTSGTILSFSGGPMVYTVVVSPASAGTDTVVSLTAGAFPHQAPAQATDATATVNYEVTAPILLTSTTTPAAPDNTNMPSTLLVNGRKPPAPDQWGPGDFDYLFAISDGADGSGLEESSIMLEDSAGVLSFSNIGRTTRTNEYGATVSTKNVDITAGTVTTIFVKVSDMAGNEATLNVGSVTLAAKTMTTPPANRAPAFASGAAISDITATAGTAITSVTLPAATDPDSGATLTYSITPAIGNGLMFDAATRVLSGTPTAMMAQTAYTYMVSDGALSATLTFNITVMAAELPANESPEIMIAAGGFVVVVRDETSDTGTSLTDYDDGIALDSWMNMPDLYDTFNTNAVHGGGALILKQSGDSSAEGYVALNPGTVGISEIMWAIDESKLGNAEMRRAGQWIELHNLNTTAVTVKLSWKTGAKDIANDGSINGNLNRPYLDVVTTVFHDRPGNAHWTLPGQNGNLNAGMNFVSAARKGTFNLTSKHDGKFNKRYTRSGHGENASNSPDGRNKDQWAASATSYDYETFVVNQVSYVTQYLGTPGRVNTFSPERADVRAGRTNVPSNTVIFNEVANRHNEAYEWIELRNVSDGNINLRNYLISIVESKPAQADRDKPDNDKIFYQFPSNDRAQIAAGGVFLLVASDPRGNPDHPLAVGYNVDIDDEDQVVGSRKNPIKYKVMRKSDQQAYQYEGTGLPDSGDFILILRRPDNGEGHRSGADGGKGVAERGKDDLDKVIDVAGRHPDLHITNYPNSVSETRLWPLRNFRAPNFNNNKFSPDIVRLRIRGAHGLGGVNDGASGVGAEGNHNDHRAAWRLDGYTGIGYKLQAADSNAHGGTPGYHGNVRGKSADLGDDKVIISEIMLSQGSRGNLPQWIELYNPSKTHAVNLADNVGWRLVIENPDRAPIITINFKNKGNVKYIPPNSTVLIVSSSARDYGSDDLPRGTVFPNTRVLNAYTAIRGETFELASRTSPLLDPKAFNLRLMDGKTHNNKTDGRYVGEISDEVGNLDGNPRTNDAAAWDFPAGMTEDGDRTSLIRIFDDGVARDGMGMVKPLGGTNGEGVDGMPGIDMKYSWTHAADTEDLSRIFVRHTWYGDESDFGTPADRTGQVLPVNLSSFRPAIEDGQVVVRWATESELDNAGFNILRSETRNGEYKQVNTELIAGNGTTGERNTYKWVDATAKPGVVYYYQIEDVSFAGEHQALAITKLKGFISAENKLTTTWGELKEVQ